MTIAQGHGLTWRPRAGGHVRLLGSTGAASATVRSEIMTSEVMTSENMTFENMTSENMTSEVMI